MGGRSAGAVPTEGRGARSRRYCTPMLRQPKRVGLPSPVAVRTRGVCFPDTLTTGDDVVSPQIWGPRRLTSRKEWGEGQYIGFFVNEKTRTLATPPMLAPGPDHHGPGRGRRPPYEERRPPGRRKTLNPGRWSSSAVVKETRLGEGNSEIKFFQNMMDKKKEGYPSNGGQ